MGVQGPALKGCVQEVGVADGGCRKRGGGAWGQGVSAMGGLPRYGASMSMCVRSSVFLSGLGGVAWSRGREAGWFRSATLACGGGALW